MSRQRRKPPDRTTDDPVLVAIETAMVRIRRSVMRRRLAYQARKSGDHIDPMQFAAVDAVEAGPDPDQGDVTIGVVAQRLSLDPSRASRLVAAAIRAGYLERRASQQDGRRVGLALTPSGQALVERKHQLRRALAERMMTGWSQRDRQDFARLFARFTELLDRGEG